MAAVHKARCVCVCVWGGGGGGEARSLMYVHRSVNVMKYFPVLPSAVHIATGNRQLGSASAQ